METKAVGLQKQLSYHGDPVARATRSNQQVTGPTRRQE